MMYKVLYESSNKTNPTPENANDFSISKPGVRVFKSTLVRKIEKNKLHDVMRNALKRQKLDRTMHDSVAETALSVVISPMCKMCTHNYLSLPIVTTKVSVREC